MAHLMAYIFFAYNTGKKVGGQAIYGDSTIDKCVAQDDIDLQLNLDLGHNHLAR